MPSTPHPNYQCTYKNPAEGLEMSEEEKRLEELEIKFSYQQEIIDSLSDTVKKQWDEIDKLKKLTKHLADEFVDLKDTQDLQPEKDPPPPHY